MSNKMVPAKIETGDRRFFVLKASEHRQGDDAYFQQFDNEANNEQAANAFMHVAEC